MNTLVGAGQMTNPESALPAAGGSIRRRMWDQLGAVKPQVCYHFGDDFELDLPAYELRSGGLRLKLKPIPMQLLILLVEHQAELVTRDQIVERIWGQGVRLDTDNSINAAVSQIRRVLREVPGEPQFVLTLPCMGYRFIAPVAISPSPKKSIRTTEMHTVQHWECLVRTS